MLWGFFVVFVLALIAFVVPFKMEPPAERQWINDRSEVVSENVGRLGTTKDPLPYPDAPLIVAHTGLVALGAALIVAVIGTIIVLLFAIASGQRRE